MRLTCVFSVSVWFLLGGLLPSNAWSQLREGEWALASFNVRYDNPSDPLPWSQRRDQVASVVGFYGMIGLQEVLPHQLQDLHERLPWMRSIGTGREADGSGESCPIFYDPSTWELLHHETLWLSPQWRQPGSVGWSADLPRIVTMGWFEHHTSGQTLRVYNTHWSHVSPEARQASAQLIALLDAPSQADATALLGDFNEESEEAARALLVEAGFLDTYDVVKARCRKSYPTYTTFLPEGSAGGPRIDAVYVKGLNVHWTCVDEVILNEYFISDHLPVHAVVSWKVLDE